MLPCHQVKPVFALLTPVAYMFSVTQEMLRTQVWMLLLLLPVLEEGHLHHCSWWKQRDLLIRKCHQTLPILLHQEEALVVTCLYVSCSSVEWGSVYSSICNAVIYFSSKLYFLSFKDSSKVDWLGNFRLQEEIFCVSSLSTECIYIRLNKLTWR